MSDDEMVVRSGMRSLDGDTSEDKNITKEQFDSNAFYSSMSTVCSAL